MNKAPLLNFDGSHGRRSCESNNLKDTQQQLVYRNLDSKLSQNPIIPPYSMQSGDYLSLISGSGELSSSNSSGSSQNNHEVISKAVAVAVSAAAAANASQISSSSEYLPSSGSSPTQNVSNSFTELQRSQQFWAHNPDSHTRNAFIDAFNNFNSNSVSRISEFHDNPTNQKKDPLTFLEHASKSAELRSSSPKIETLPHVNRSDHQKNLFSHETQLSTGMPYTNPSNNLPQTQAPSSYQSNFPPISRNFNHQLPSHGGSNHYASHPYIPGGYPIGLDAARRKNATRENTATLKAWLQEHIKNPYPTKGEKIMLAIITKMTLTQVSTWFANARRRLKKENKMTWSPKVNSGASGNSGSANNRDIDENEIDSQDIHHGMDRNDGKSQASDNVFQSSASASEEDDDDESEEHENDDRENTYQTNNSYPMYSNAYQNNLQNMPYTMYPNHHQPQTEHLNNPNYPMPGWPHSTTDYNQTFMNNYCKPTEGNNSLAAAVAAINNFSSNVGDHCAYPNSYE